jgi:hypothetical protein
MSIGSPLSVSAVVINCRPGNGLGDTRSDPCVPPFVPPLKRPVLGSRKLLAQGSPASCRVRWAGVACSVASDSGRPDEGRLATWSSTVTLDKPGYYGVRVERRMYLLPTAIPCGSYILPAVWEEADGCESCARDGGGQLTIRNSAPGNTTWNFG